MAAVARSPSPSPSPAAARPCPAMRRSADSNPFNPADCPSQRSASSKGGCGCHHAASPSPRRRSLSSSFGEKENDPVRTTPKAAPRSSKNFMAPTISAASKAASPRNATTSGGKVLGERNHDTPHLAPFSPANLAHKPKPDPRRLRLSFDAPPAPAPAPAGDAQDPVRAAAVSHHHHHHHAASDSVGLRHSFEAPPAAAAPLAGDDDDDAGMGDPVRVGAGAGVNHPHAAPDPVYDPKTNYTSPRPRFLHYKPNPRVHIYRHGRAGVRRLEDGFASASESSDETTEDDHTEEEEEQEQAQQNHPSEEQPALAAPSEAAEAACVLAPDPAPGSPPPAPLLLSSPAPAAVTPEPARVSAPEPRATPPRARALTPEPELGARAPPKKGSSWRFLLPLAFVLFMSAASVCVLLQPDSPIMSNTALSKASGFLSVQESHPVELAAWLKQWSSSSLDSITSYWEALASPSAQEQQYFGPHFGANWSAAAADGDHHGAAADFYYNFAEAWPVPPGEEPISSANALTAEPEGDAVVEGESVDDAGVGEQYDASDYYDMVVDELDVEMPEEEAPGSSYGSSVLEEQLKIQDAVSEASSADLIAESEGVAAAVVEEESDASGYSKVAVDELDLGASEAAPAGSSKGEEISQDLDTPSQPAEQGEQDVESEEPEDNHGNGKEGQEEPHLGLESDSSMPPSYLDRISKPAAAAGVALVVVILSAGIAALSMRKKQAQVATSANVPAEQEQAEEAEARSGSASSEGHRLAKSPRQAEEETERFGDSGFSQYSSSLSSGHGHGRGEKTKEEEENVVGLEPAFKRESMSYSTSSYGSFTTYEKIAAKKRNKDDEAMTPVRRSSRLRSVKSPEAGSS